MTRRKIVIGIPLVILCAAVAVAFWPEKEIPEPVYKGKKLSEWLELRVMKKDLVETSTALEAVGTNGIPFYLEWIRYQPGLLWSGKILVAARFREWFHIAWSPQDPYRDRAYGAYLALQALGERAEPAIPQFVAFATNLAAIASPRSVDNPIAGCVGLAHIGRPAIPAFLSQMTNENPRIRAMAVAMSMNNYQTSIMAQVRISLQDPDYSVKSAARNVMKFYDPDLIPPHKE